MDQSAVKKFVNEHTNPLLRFLGLGDWEVRQDFRHMANASGKCSRNGEYRRAWVTYSPEDIQDEDELLDIMFHEFMHIVLWPFDLYRNVTTQHIDNASSAQMADNSLFHHAIEMMLSNLEVIWKDHLRDLYLERYTRP